MTVKELIAELEKVENKDLPVVYYDEHWEPEVCGVREDTSEEGKPVIRLNGK